MPQEANPSPVSQSATNNNTSSNNVVRSAASVTPPASSPRLVREVSSTPKKSSVSGLGISLSALTQEKPEDKVIEEKQEQVLTQTFTPIELLNEWRAYAESLTEEHHLKNTMINCLPNLLNRDTFEVVVNNPVQEQRLLENGVGILSELRKNLRNTQIQMKVRVTVDNEKRLGFTSLEKYNLMVEQNDSLKRLKDEFGLELL